MVELPPEGRGGGAILDISCAWGWDGRDGAGMVDAQAAADGGRLVGCDDAFGATLGSVS